ncbi:MAG: hypothetical protein NXI20_16815 [bacterium]|nr:hypothetical protein [bacterium]
MKHYLIAILTLLAFSCQEDLINEMEPSMTGSTISESSDVSTSTQNRPKVRFRKLKNGATRVVLVDNEADTTGFLNLTLQCCESISFTFQKIEHKYRTRVEADASFEGQTVTIAIEYLDSKGNVTGNDKFEVYVFEDGTSAVQEPSFYENAISGTALGSELFLSVQAAGDPAGIVEEAIFDVVYRTKEGKEVKEQYSSTEKRLYSSNPGYAFLMTKRTARPIEFGEDDAIEATVSVSFKDADGNTVLGPQTQALQFADFTGRIKRIRIKKRRTGSGFSLSVVQGGGTPGVVATAEVIFEEPFEGPTPSENVLTLDAKPSSNSNIRFVNKDLSFDGNAIGLTYPVTVFLKDYEGEIIGEPLSTEVLVEDDMGDFEITVIDKTTYLFSVRFNNENKWIDNATIEFEEPFEGPAPLETTIELSSAGIDESGIETMQGKVVFEDVPNGEYQLRGRYRGPKAKIARRFREPIFGPSK